MRIIRLFFTILGLPGPGRISAHRTVSTVVHLDEISYYLHPKPVSTNTNLDSIDPHLVAEPCTLLHLDDASVDKRGLNQTLHLFSAKDDVWSWSFMQCTIFQTTKKALTLSEDSKHHLRNLGTENIFTIHVPNKDHLLPQGPYFINYGAIYEAYRLYSDTSQAFVVATVPAASKNSYRALDVAAYGEQNPDTLTVAVPSRLYHRPTKEKPFAGLRIALKDVIDLQGLKTGASCRAYTQMYPPKEQSAVAVQKLVDLGFVIVGKLKTTQFADSEWPTSDWIDYSSPFNPRGDGYLTPSSGSPGSASAVASYDWLDYSLGTDSLAGIVAPAAVHALFGMRPTVGAASTKGVLTYSPRWDTIGGFARTAPEFKTLAQALYGTPGDENQQFKKPTQLLYPKDYWNIQDPASKELFERFVSHVEKYLGVARTEISLTDIWEQNRPEGLSDSLEEAFNYTFDWTSNLDQWRHTLKPFIQAYEQKMGKHPYLNPQLRFKEKYSPTITEAQQREGNQLLSIYHDWFFKHVMPPSEHGYSSTIMILPWTTGEPLYRDAYKLGPQEFTGRGFFYYNIAPYADCPELVFPVGTTSYLSNYTGQAEKLPAALGILTAKGSDMMLVDLIERLFRGWDTTVPAHTSETEMIIQDL